MNVEIKLEGRKLLIDNLYASECVVRGLLAPLNFVKNLSLFLHFGDSRSARWVVENLMELALFKELKNVSGNNKVVSL